jgi:hypothetical protein
MTGRETKKMIVNYSDQPIQFSENSIMLCGPTPRGKDVLSWRPAALDYLRKLKFDGLVYIPERQDWSVQFDYLDQVEWEFQALESAKIIVFWVPRNMKTMIGLTTNVEFGKYIDSDRMVYGRPDDAENIRYLDWMYSKYVCLNPSNDLYHLLERAVQWGKRG